MGTDTQSEVTEQEESTLKQEADETNEYAEKLKACEQASEGYKQSYLRALADYKNLEHRVQNQRQQMRENIKREFVEQFLPILDHLQQAEVFMDDPGLRMVSESFHKTLGELGVKEIDLLGNDFDPQYAEAIEVVPGKQDNVIVEVLQRAYELGGQVIRHGKVKVSKQEVDSRR